MCLSKVEILLLITISMILTIDTQAQVDTIDANRNNQSPNRDQAQVVGLISISKSQGNTLSFTTLDFGKVSVDSSRTQLLSILNRNDTHFSAIINSSSNSILLSKDVLNGPPTGPLGEISRIQRDTLHIAPHDSTLFGVTFAPLAERRYSEIISFFIDAQSNDTLAIKVSGIGTRISGEVLIDLDTQEGNQRLSRVEKKGDASAMIQLFAHNIPVSSLYHWEIAFSSELLSFVENSFGADEISSGHPPTIKISQSGRQSFVAITIGTINGPMLPINHISSIDASRIDSLRDSLSTMNGYLGSFKVSIADTLRDSTSVSITKLGYSLGDSVVVTKRGTSAAWIINAKLPLLGDFNNDTQVDFRDFLMFIQGLKNNDIRFDLTYDGKIDFDDFRVFSNTFGRSK